MLRPISLRCRRRADRAGADAIAVRRLRCGGCRLPLSHMAPPHAPRQRCRRSALSLTGLEIADVVAGSERDEDGEVAFTARWCTAEGRRGVLVERSRFVRRAGRWLYLDGDHS